VSVPEPIRILPDDLANQIAAGEVVERPASVVKELIENALDAGAERIEVSIEGGGITLIRVADDGHGMSEEDAPRCLGRHATSKLRAFADLEEIASYGFRGEALPSVASVSRLSIRTRTRQADSGLLLEVEGTTAPTLSPIGSPVGTTIEVRDLFFNVPARRKFLRSSNTESGHVGEVVVGAALSRPDVSFAFHRDGRKAKAFERVSVPKAGALRRSSGGRQDAFVRRARVEQVL
jgi:DNA mismatch repair protein MutL